MVFPACLGSHRCIGLDFVCDCYLPGSTKYFTPTTPSEPSGPSGVYKGIFSLFSDTFTLFFQLWLSFTTALACLIFLWILLLFFRMINSIQMWYDIRAFLFFLFFWLKYSLVLCAVEHDFLVIVPKRRQRCDKKIE